MDLNIRTALYMSLVLFNVMRIGYGQAQYRPKVPKFHRPGQMTKIYTPGTRSYDKAWYTVDDRQHFFFHVQSCGTAYLALSETTDATEEYSMEIALGAEGNTHSTLSFMFDVGPLYRTPTYDILHCNELRQFWIRWDRGWIEVGRGPLLGDQKFINYYDVYMTKKIISIGLASEKGYGALWKVMENSGHFLMASTPNSHRYDTVWKSVSDRYFMSFVLMACGHGHIVLTAEEGQTTNNLYEFVIGGWDNNRTVIRTEILGGYKVGVETPKILTCDRVREFWISWLEGVFTVGRGGMYGENALVTWTDPNPTPIRYMSISTGFGATGRWFLYEDREEVNYLITQPTDDTGLDMYGTYWIESPGKKEAFFSITACTDARILLSEYNEGDSEFDIEIRIGEQNNTKISFGYLTEMGNIAEASVAPLLDCIDPETFWIDWYNGTVRIGKGITPGSMTLLEKKVLPDDSEFQFKAYSFATPVVKGLWRFRESNGERLQVKTPNTFNHFNQVWRSVPHKDYFKFRLKACHDGHIALSPTPGVIPGETYLDVIFGGWGNTQSVISRVKGDDINDRFYLGEFAQTPDLLQCDKRHVDLWVSWKDDELSIGKGSLVGHHVFARASMDRSYPIKYIGMSTGWGSTGDFLVEEDNGDLLTFYMPEKAWIAVDIGITWIRFNLRGCKDARIYLSAISGVAQGDFYEIAIGSEDNKKSYIKLQYDLKTEVETPDILNCEDNHPFWISWKDGKVEVGKGFLYGVNPFMSWNDPRPFEVLGIGLTSQDPDMWGRYQILENVGYLTTFETPVDYQYHTAWRSVEHAQSTIVGVKACSDAHIVLSSQTRTEEGMFEVVIGGWQNTRSAIRMHWGEAYVNHYEDNLVSCTETRQFWISWADDTIEVGRGEMVGKNRIMEYHPLQMYEIRSIGFSTGYGYNGTWTLKLWNGLIPVGPPVTPGPELTSPPPLGNTGGLNGGQIAGVVIGALGAVVLIGLIITSMVYMRQGKDIPLLPADGSGLAASGALNAGQAPNGSSVSAESPGDSNA